MKKLMTNLINKISKKRNQVKVAAITTVITLGMSIPALAAPNVGESTSTWVLNQLFYFVIIIIAVSAMKMYQGGNTMKLIITLCVGGFILFIIKNPTILETLGNWMAEISGIR